MKIVVSQKNMNILQAIQVISEPKNKIIANSDYVKQ